MVLRRKNRKRWFCGTKSGSGGFAAEKQEAGDSLMENTKRGFRLWTPHHTTLNTLWGTIGTAVCLCLFVL